MKKPLARKIAAKSLNIFALAALLATGCERVELKPKDDSPPVVTTDGSVQMVSIPGGRFEMGSARKDELDESAHEVHVSSFHMDKHEVTQEEYDRVMGVNPSRRKAEKNPVEQIRWADATRYCNARSRLDGLQPAYDPTTWKCDFAANGYRLPTEAEWEYAARAGTKTLYSFGNDPSQLKQHGWSKVNATRGPRPVGQREPNPLGLYDMYGNVWEWCNDFYREDYYRQSPEDDPRGPEAGEQRVVRGGCWNSKPDMCRSSYRNYEDPGFTDACFAKEVSGFVGFRCVRNR